MKAIIPIPALTDNYIWMIVDDAGETAWVVDPGDASPVIHVLNQYGLSLAGILITHHHADHCGGVPALLHYSAGIPVFGSHKSPNPHISHRLQESDEIVSTAFQFKVIEIPGHTLDHIAYYGNNCLFSGDTLFSAGCGRIFEGTAQMMWDSLDKLEQLDGETELYCGHEYTLANLMFAQYVEPNNLAIQKKIEQVKHRLSEGKSTLPSLLSEEKSINPFLRCRVPDIICAVEKYAGKKLKNGVEVFAYLRELKNNFR